MSPTKIKFVFVVLCMVCWAASGSRSVAQHSAQLQASARASLPGSAGAAAAPAPSSGMRPDYVIGPGDLLTIDVWQSNELSGTMPVRPDGRISLPMIGEMQAAGRSTMQLQAEITAKLKEYVNHPEVTVIVKEIHSRTFNVVGKVTKPGSFDLTRPTTVLDAIAMAGGFKEYAKTSKAYVLRRAPNGTLSRLPFDYKRVIKGKSPEQDVLLQSGDTVVVP